MPIKHPAHHYYSGVLIQIGKVIVHICYNEKMTAKKLKTGEFGTERGPTVTLWQRLCGSAYRINP